jgi:AraC-like DNA-binding protein
MRHQRVRSMERLRIHSTIMICVEKPAPALQHLVRQYVQVCNPPQCVLQPIPACTAPGLEFVFADPYRVRLDDPMRDEPAHAMTVVGTQTYRRVHLDVRGRIESFVIIFQPGGLSRLFSVQSEALTNQHFDARAVLGAPVDELRCRLGESMSFLERTHVANAFLLHRCARTESHDVTPIAREILRRSGRVRISDVAHMAGVSVRQLERRFVSQIGVSPKLYARISRFEGALKAKKQTPAAPWTDIAHRLGYHDQMHMLHDFRQLAGSTPSELTARLGIVLAGEFGSTPS